MTDDIQYRRFHVPGVLHLPCCAINTTDQFGVSYSSGTDQLIRMLGLFGVNPASHSVIDDDLGGLNACRLYWELEGLGHQRIALLDGELVTWILEGRKVSNKLSRPEKPQSRQPRKMAELTWLLWRLWQKSPGYPPVSYCWMGAGGKNPPVIHVNLVPDMFPLHVGGRGILPWTSTLASVSTPSRNSSANYRPW